MGALFSHTVRVVRGSSSKQRAMCLVDGSRSSFCSCWVVYLRVFLNLGSSSLLFMCVIRNQQRLSEIMCTRIQVPPDVYDALKIDLMTDGHRHNFELKQQHQMK